MDRPPDLLSEPGFSIEEVIGPDGRYVLYYRWTDDATGADPSPDSGRPPLPRPDSPPDV